mgnify:FL=1
MDSGTAFPIPSTYSRIIARVARLQERDLDKLLSGTGLPRSILMPGDESHINGEQQVRILQNGRRLLQAPDFGLRLGQQLQPSTHGPLGYLALSSPDLLGALKALSDYLPLRLPWVAVELSIGTETICAELKFLMSLDDNPVEQITMAEAFSVVLQSFVEAILGRPASEAQITYAHATPDYAQRYGDYLHAPFRFGSVSNSYRLPVQLASTPNASGDDASYRLTQQLCQQLLEQTPRSASSMADRVRTLLLLTPIESLTEDVVARRLYVSRRTLARRLAAEGTGYRQIREQFLHELARSYLLQANQTVDTVAASLGYHDASAFRKAFKRWTGMTPKDFRARSASAS